MSETGTNRDETNLNESAFSYPGRLKAESQSQSQPSLPPETRQRVTARNALRWWLDNEKKPTAFHLKSTELSLGRCDDCGMAINAAAARAMPILDPVICDRAWSCAARPRDGPGLPPGAIVPADILLRQRVENKRPDSALPLT